MIINEIPTILINNLVSKTLTYNKIKITNNSSILIHLHLLIHLNMMMILFFFVLVILIATQI